MPAEHLFDLYLPEDRDRIERFYGLRARRGYARAVSYGSYIQPDVVEFYDDDGRILARYDYNDQDFIWELARKDLS